MRCCPGWCASPGGRSSRGRSRARGDVPDEQLHDLRIRAKRCRYAAEAAAAATGKNAAKFAREVAALQEVLGELHDAVVAEALAARAIRVRLGFTRPRCSPPASWSRSSATRRSGLGPGGPPPGSASSRGGPVPGDEVTSYLVRHAKAGSRERWTAPDRDRPLTAAGRIQAVALVEPARTERPERSCRARTSAASRPSLPLAEALGLQRRGGGSPCRGCGSGVGDGRARVRRPGRCSAPTATSWRRS